MYRELDWTTIISKSYWPILVLLLVLLFKNKIQHIFWRHPTYGEFLVELNKDKKILNAKSEKIASRTSAEEIWALNDIAKNKENGFINKMNPVQKYMYYEMLEKGLVRKEGEYVVLTNVGQQILALAKAIDF